MEKLLNTAAPCVEWNTWKLFIVACAKQEANPYEELHVLLEDYAQFHNPQPEPGEPDPRAITEEQVLAELDKALANLKAATAVLDATYAALAPKLEPGELDPRD